MVMGGHFYNRLLLQCKSMKSAIIKVRINSKYTQGRTKKKRDTTR